MRGSREDGKKDGGRRGIQIEDQKAVFIFKLQKFEITDKLPMARLEKFQPL